MNMAQTRKTYILHHVSLWSLFKIGSLVGFITSFIPLMSIVYLFVRLVSSLAEWLGGLVMHLRLPLPGDFGIDLNLIELLKLQGFYESLQKWASVGGFSAFLIALLLTLLAALFWGLIAVFAGIVFNLLGSAIGGIQFTMSEQVSVPSPTLIDTGNLPREVKETNE